MNLHLLCEIMVEYLDYHIFMQPLIKQGVTNALSHFGGNKFLQGQRTLLLFLKCIQFEACLLPEESKII